MQRVKAMDRHDMSFGVKMFDDSCRLGEKCPTIRVVWVQNVRRFVSFRLKCPTICMAKCPRFVCFHTHSGFGRHF